MKKAGLPLPLFSPESGLLLVHLGLLARLLGRLLGRLLLVGFLFHLLVGLVHLVLGNGAVAHRREGRREQDGKKLLHRDPLLWLGGEWKNRPKAQSAPGNARPAKRLTAVDRPVEKQVANQSATPAKGRIIAAFFQATAQ